jgi:hypothetical protein
MFLSGVIGITIWKTYFVLKQSIWDGEHQLNIVIDAQPVILVSFEPVRDPPLNILTIPEQTQIEIVHDFGFYRLESVTGLAGYEGRIGGQLLAESLSEYLGIPQEAYISELDIKQADNKNPTSFISETIWNLLRGHGRTNLSKWDLVRLLWQIKLRHLDRSSLINLCDDDVCYKETLIDGSEVIKINLEKADRITDDYFKDNLICQESLTISVLNQTSSVGLANTAARMITKIGGRVIQIGEEKDTGIKCILRTNPRLFKSYTLKRLKRIFGCQLQIGEINSQRADIVLIVS